MKLVCIAVGLLLAATSSEAFLKSFVDDQCIATPANTEEFGYTPHAWECLPDELGQQFHLINGHICNSHSNPGCIAVPNDSDQPGQELFLWEMVKGEKGQQWQYADEEHWINGHELCLQRTPSHLEGYADILTQEECNYGEGSDYQRFEFTDDLYPTTEDYDYYDNNAL